MPVLKVAEFVGQHRFDFAGLQALEQGVEEHDPLVRAEAGEIGVAMAGTLGSVHDEDAAVGKTAALQQIDDALAEGLILQGDEAIEDRRDQRGIEPEHGQGKRHPRQPAV